MPKKNSGNKKTEEKTDYKREFKLLDENPGTVYLSASRIGMHVRCPKQYEFRYVEGLKMRPSGAMILGGSWHSALEVNYKQKIDSRSDIKVTDMTEIFADSFDERVKNEEIDWKDEKPGVVKDVGVSITILHHKQIAPTVQPVTVEQEFLVPFTDTNKLYGFLDVIDSVGKKRFIVENKSAGRTPSEDEVFKDVQLTAYSYAYRSLYGKNEDGIRKDIAVKTKVPKTVQMKTTRDGNSIEILRQMAKGVESNTKSGVFPPNPNSFLCSKKWCGFWDLCMGKKQKTTIFSDLGGKK